MSLTHIYPLYKTGEITQTQFAERAALLLSEELAEKDFSENDDSDVRIAEQFTQNKDIKEPNPWNELLKHTDETTGNNFLHHACAAQSHGAASLFKILISLKLFDPSIVNKLGSTAFAYLIQNGYSGNREKLPEILTFLN